MAGSRFLGRFQLGPAIPGRGQVHFLHPPSLKSAEHATWSGLVVGAAARGMPELVVGGCLPGPARREARTPIPRRPRALSSARVEPVIQGASGRPGGGPVAAAPTSSGSARRPPSRANPRGAQSSSSRLHVLELTDFVGQFVRHAGGASARSGGNTGKGAGPSTEDLHPAEGAR